MVLDGISERQAACYVGVSHGAVANRFREYADGLPDDLPVPSNKVEVAEKDELFTFVGNKKYEVYIMTNADRETRCFLEIQAIFQRSQDIRQQMLREAPAEQYYSDMFPLCDSLSYHKGYHLSLLDKSENYSVEADNFELRHYTRAFLKSRK